MRLLLAALWAVTMLLHVPTPAGAAEDRSFKFSSSDAKSFYDGYDEARKLSKAQNYPAAIKQYEAILQYADTFSKEAMVYNDLAKIYHALGDVDQEIANVEKASRVTTDKKQKDALVSRLKQLRRASGRTFLKPPSTSTNPPV